MDAISHHATCFLGYTTLIGGARDVPPLALSIQPVGSQHGSRELARSTTRLTTNCQQQGNATRAGTLTFNGKVFMENLAVMSTKQQVTANSRKGKNEFERIINGK
jgi:hypothetical protein